MESDKNGRQVMQIIAIRTLTGTFGTSPLDTFFFEKETNEGFLSRIENY